jgi:hypothetical protein
MCSETTLRERDVRLGLSLRTYTGSTGLKRSPDSRIPTPKWLWARGASIGRRSLGDKLPGTVRAARFDSYVVHHRSPSASYGWPA